MTKHKPAIVESEIGARIRALRVEKGFTLEQLARQSGFTKGYLSKVEKSVKAPPVSTLGNIARVLNTTISALLGEERLRASLCLVRKTERPLVTMDGNAFGYSYEALASGYSNKIMEPFILTLPLGGEKKTFFKHEGEEILFVIQGKMKFIHGTDEYLVKEGDCIYFDSNIPHFGVSVGRKEVQCFMVICNPNHQRRMVTHAG